MRGSSFRNDWAFQDGSSQALYPNVGPFWAWSSEQLQGCTPIKSAVFTVLLDNARAFLCLKPALDHVGWLPFSWLGLFSCFSAAWWVYFIILIKSFWDLKLLCKRGGVAWDRRGWGTRRPGWVLSPERAGLGLGLYDNWPWVALWVSAC